MPTRILLTTIILFISLCLLSGCVKLERSYPDRRFFLLHASRPGEASPGLTDEVLRVLPFSVSPPYEDKGFVYLRRDNRYESDFYHGFFVSPGTMLTEEVRKWMSESGLFRHVVDLAGYGEPSYLLTGRVGALYADYSETSAPKAVLEMEFLLTHDVSGKSATILHKAYRRQISLSDSAPGALINGWNKALGSILSEFEGHLRECL